MSNNRQWSLGVALGFGLLSLSGCERDTKSGVQNRQVQSPNVVVAHVVHAPDIGGRVDGTIRLLTGEDTKLDGNAYVNGNLQVPGEPQVVVKGNATYGGTVPGAGSPQPANYTITLTGGAHLDHVINRTDPTPLDPVAAPPRPTGTRDVHLTQAGQSPGDFSTLRDLKLSGNAGAVAVPPGTYGDFAASGASQAFVFGDAKSTQPTKYNLQSLTLEGSQLRLVGPVEVVLQSGVSLSAAAIAGTAGNPSMLRLNVAGGSVNLTGQSSMSAVVRTPAGALRVQGASQFEGSSRTLYLIVSAGSAYHGVTSQPPTVANPAAAAPPVVVGTSTTVTCLGADENGEASLTYTWTSMGPSAVTFNPNGTNAAKVSTATFSAAGSYTLTCTITNSSGQTASSSTGVTVLQTGSAVAVSPATANVPLNGTQQFTASEKDQFGNPMSPQPQVVWTVNGCGSIDQSGKFTAGPVPSGPCEVRATAPDGQTGTAQVTVANTPPAVAQPAAANPNPVGGTSTQLTVLGADDGGEANLTYTWSSMGPAAVAFSANGTNAAKSTTATFSKAGSYTFQVVIRDAGGLTATSSVNVTVNQTLTAAQVAPAAATVGLHGQQQFTATGFDQFGAQMATSPAFAWSVSGGGTIDQNGLFTAGGTAGGPFTVTAQSGGVKGTATVSVTDSAPTVAQPAAANPNPVPGTSSQLSVLGADDGGEANLTYTWSVAGPFVVTFSQNGTNSAKNMTATFSGAGSYNFTVTMRDGSGQSTTSSVVVQVNQTLTTIAVMPASATVAENGKQQFTASGSDQFGKAMAPQPQFTWSVSGGGTIDQNGLFTAGATTGSFTVTAQNGTVKGTAQVNVVNNPPTVAQPASANPNPVAGTSTQLSALGADDGGEPSLTYTWSSTGPASVTFSANGTNAAKNTTATFSRAGNYTFTVTIRDADGNTVQSSVNVTVNQTLTSASVAPASATVALNGKQQFTATGSDQFGQVMAPQPGFTWTVSGGGTIDQAGLFTAGNVPGGPFTVTAQNGTVKGTASVTVADTPPTVAQPANANPNPVGGTSAQLTALGADDGGEATLTYSWTVSGPSPVTFSVNGNNAAKNTTATFTGAGSYTFTVTISDSGGHTVQSSVNVTVNQTLTSIAVAPAAANVGLNGKQQFTASGSDQFSKPMATQPSFAWSVNGCGTIDQTGLFTAGNTAGGPCTVTAASGGKQGTAQVTVQDGSPTVAQAAAANPNPAGGTSTNLSVLGADDGGEANLTYTWMAAGPAAVTFSANGTNAAKNTTATFQQAGSYTFTVVIRDAAAHTTQSQVTVQVNQTLTAVGVSPQSATVGTGKQQQFTASGSDQFSKPMAPQPAFAWTVDGCGSIDQSGLFTAGNVAAGPCTVRAASGGTSGTAQVTVVANQPPTVAQPASANPNPVSGTFTSLSALGADDGGEPSLTYTWAAAGPAAVSFSQNGTNASKVTTATFIQAGSYNLTVTIKDASGLSNTSSVVVVVNQTVSAASVAPGSATVALNGKQQFTASGTDQFGKPMSPQPAFMWNITPGCGTIDQTGLFTAGNVPGGPCNISAQSGVATGTATVTVQNGTPTVAQNANANPNPVAGTFTSLSVLGADDGGEANLTYTWSANGPAQVTYSANGTNAAKNTTATFTAAGSYNFTVIIRDPSNATTTSSVAVTVQQTLTSAAASPATATVTVNQPLAESGSSFDQFGAPMSTQPAFSWTKVSGPGNVTFSAQNSASTNVTFDAAGSYVIRVTASDGVHTPTADATITVNPASQVPKAVASATPSVVRRGTPINVQLDGSASQGGNLSYKWDIGGATLVMGQLTDPVILVNFGASNDLVATLAVKNNFGADSATVRVKVNDPPVALAGSDRTASPNVAVTLDGTGTTDREGDPITYAWSITSSPPGSNPTLAANNTATPSFTGNLPGTYTIQLIASDPLGPAPAVTTNVRVFAASQNPPVVTVTATPSVVAVGTAVALKVTAAGDNAIATRTLTVNGTSVALDGQGNGSFTPGAAGTFECVAVATDVAGNSTKATTNFSAHSAADNGGSTATITAPIDGAILTGTTTVTGTASDADLTLYTVELSIHNANIWTRVGSGTTSKVNTTLGSIDPTLLADGTYDLRLQVFDSYGHVTTTTRRVILNDTRTVGNLHFSVTDVNIVLGGFSIKVTRTYDSMKRVDGDFGANWEIGYVRFDHMEETNPAGDGWNFNNQGPGCQCLFGTCDCCDFGCSGACGTTETKSHRVSARVGSRTLTWQFCPTFDGCITGASAYIAHWVPVGNVYGATLSGGGEGTPLFNLMDGTNTMVDQGTFDTFDPQDFTVTLLNGQKYSVNIKTGLTRALDNLNQGITIDATGVTHSSGLKVAYTRDASNHITKITLPDGVTARTYQYDNTGNLIATTDFDGKTTRYLYAAGHMIRQILDANGNAIATNTYDSSGRLTSVQDDTGSALAYSYDLPNNTTTFTDAVGGTTSATFNARGLITSETNAAGLTTTYAYDANGNLLTKTDPRGNVMNYTYNANNQETSRKLITGITQNSTYDAKGNSLTHTDGLGHTESWTYDANSHVTSRTDLESGTVGFAYDANGNLNKYTMPTGGVAPMTVDNKGYITAITDLTGATRNIANNTQGAPTSETVTVGGVNYNATMAYSNVGIPTSMKGLDGATSSASYDGDGHPTTVSDAFGATTKLTYASNGTIPSRTLANGGVVSATFDALGRKTSQTSPEGRMTNTSFNSKGQKTGETAAGGGTTTYGYNAFGEVSSVTDAFGGTTNITYDNLGRPTSSMNAVGLTTSTSYDSLSRVSSETNAMGVTRAYTRNGRGDPLTVSIAGAPATQYAYDAGAHPTSVTDPLGNKTTLAYDAAGRKTSVTDAAGGVVALTYNTFGLTTFKSPDGDTTTYVRDPGGNITSRTLQGGLTESFTYNRAARTNTRTGFDGTATTYQFDAMKNVTSIQAFDGTTSGRTYDKDTLISGITGNAGNVALVRDADGHIVRQTEIGGATVSYTYDVAGFSTSMTTPFGTTTYTRDVMGRVTSATDANGKVTTISYDGHGLPGTLTYPSGVVETRTYDSAARLASVTVKNGGTTLFGESYAYDTGDRPTTVTEASGRIVAYTYDKLNRLLSESVTPAGGGAQLVTGYTYSAGGNLTSITRPNNGSPEGVGVTSITYGANDRALTETGPGYVAAYTYDLEGRLLSVAGGPNAATYTYDGLGRLTKAVTGGTNSRGVHTVLYTYDGGGLLISRSLDGTVRNFVWDRRGDVARLVYETDAQGNAVSQTIRAGAALLQYQGGTLKAIHRDRIGSMRMLTDPSGAASAEQQYSGYGEFVEGTTWTDTVGYGFAGERTDPATGNVYLRARWMAPGVGRFLTADEGQSDYTNTQTVNRYIYAGSSPTLYVDPTGRQFDLVSINISISISVTLDMTAVANFFTTMSYIFSTLALALAVGFEGYAGYGAIKDGTHLFDFSRQADATIVGSSLSFGVFGGYVRGEEVLFWRAHLADGQVPKQSVAAYTYSGWFVSGGLNLNLTGSEYGGQTWDTPTADSYTGPFATISVSIGLGSKTLASAIGIPLLERALSIGGGAFWSPSPSALTDGGENQCYGWTAGGAGTYQLPLPGGPPFVFTFQYITYDLIPGTVH